MANPISRPPASSGQGEALATWGLWGVLLAMIAVTYTRLDSEVLYHVTGNGLSGAMSRVVVEMNYPLSLVSIPLILIALDALPRGWWWVGGPALVLCAVTAWPGVVDDADLDVRLINAVPALGVMTALVLSLVAARRTSARFAPRSRYDPVRVALVLAVLVLSLPWIAADLGFYLPDSVFIMERPVTGSDGVTTTAVHLGHHHGFDGALILISALVLSRARLRSASLALATKLFVSLMLAYGAVNFAQDFWHEQIVKRHWSEWQIPGATKPSLTLIWLVILAATAGAALLLSFEERSRSDPASG